VARRLQTNALAPVLGAVGRLGECALG
jgi:hypothetical protein